jgi:hypothetical protein
MEIDATISSGLRVVPSAEVSEVPAGLHVHGSLIIAGNPLLAILGDRIRIFGSLDLHDCLRLKKIGARLQVAGDCDLSGCANLLSIGEDLLISRDLDLTGCNPSLSLPRKGSVGGTLILPLRFDSHLLHPTFVVKGEIRFA